MESYRTFFEGGCHGVISAFRCCGGRRAAVRDYCVMILTCLGTIGAVAAQSALRKAELALLPSSTTHGMRMGAIFHKLNHGAHEHARARQRTILRSWHTPEVSKKRECMNPNPNPAGTGTPGARRAAGRTTSAALVAGVPSAAAAWRAAGCVVA
jgi:hypothetical protein